MPAYIFSCPKDQGGCGENSEIVVTMAEISGLQPVCDKCGNTHTQRDYSAIQVHDGTPRTVGALADRNAAKYSDSYKSHLLAEQKTKKEKRKF